MCIATPSTLGCLGSQVSGLPPNLFSHRNAIIAGVLVAGVFIAVVSTYNGVKRATISDPMTPPICYGQVQHIPGTERLPVRGPTGGANNLLERVALAEAGCTPKACPREAWGEYRSSVFWYISDRTQQPAKLYRAYGEAGLRRARDLYGTPMDERVERGLRERHAADVFRFDQFQQHGSAIAILVRAGGEKLRPCSVNDPIVGR